MPNSSWFAFLFGPGRTRDYWRQSHVNYRDIFTARGVHYFYSKSGIAGFELVSVNLERVTGIEPAWPAWKAGALPLSYTRVLCDELTP